MGFKIYCRMPKLSSELPGNQCTHTKAVEDTIQARRPNGVLGMAAPDVKVEEEEDTTREERTTLAQLRTGFCKALNDYQHRINAPIGVVPLLPGLARWVITS